MRTLLLLFALASLALPTYAIPKQVRDTTAERPAPLAPFYVPAGTVNLARGKLAASSDDAPKLGPLSLITDGNKDIVEGSWVELGPGSQWVQIDLGEPCRIFGVQTWRYFGETRVYRDVVVRLADDADFINNVINNVRTIYNNDRDNSS